MRIVKLVYECPECGAEVEVDEEEFELLIYNEQLFATISCPDCGSELEQEEVEF